MNVRSQLLRKTHRSFRFGSGHVVTLTEDQINKIPYLAAFVSSADFFECARDGQGYFIIHPKIDLEPFRFILDWFPYRHIRDLFIHLPEDHDPILTILHMDYFGLLIHRDPSLDEVDVSFFDTITYNPLNNSYVEVHRPSQMCDMVVRFAIALVREAYDSTDDKVHERIYWYVMFITSAFRLFHRNVRRHVFKVAKRYFRLFKPCLIRRLNRLQSSQDKYVRMNRRDLNNTFSEWKQAEEKNFKSLIDSHIAPKSSYFYSPIWLDFHFGLYNFWDNDREDLFPPQWRTTTQTLLEPLYKALVETIYDQMQNQIRQCVWRDVCKAPLSSQLFAESQNDEPLHFLELLGWASYSNLSTIRESMKNRRIARHIIEQTMLWNMFANEVSKEETQYLIMDGLSHLKLKLEQEHRQLIHEIQIFQAERETEHTDSNWWFLSLRPLPSSGFERKQLEALTYEQLLGEVNQPSMIIAKICEHLLKKLNEAAVNQVTGWVKTTYEVYKIGPSIARFDVLHPDSTLYTKQGSGNRYHTFKPTPTKQLHFFRNRFR
ncbi:unnamed protein product [Adineta ricciae]|uniref:Uncharacterized protein n=1 Tax=Adineta ricciae TaxID=249248 RepID=A0A815KVW5_ADIRI|nr:unnamed protein product [Adineta ricciae]CAF1400823.1 unnamed protein product [Adineta ricciae]